MHQHGHFCFWGLVDVKTKGSTVETGFASLSIISVFRKHIQLDSLIQVFSMLQYSLSPKHSQNPISPFSWHATNQLHQR